MKLLIRPKRTFEEDESYIFAMTNVTGIRVKNPKPLNFSFFFSQKSNNKHGIRVKVSADNTKVQYDTMSNLQLHGDYELTQNPKGKKISSKLYKEMVGFFQYYKVLFAMTWENKIDPDIISDYFKDRIDLPELLTYMYDYEEYKDLLENVYTCEQLEKVVRENHLFNMND